MIATALRLLIWFTILTGVVYPIAVTAIGHGLFLGAALLGVALTLITEGLSLLGGVARGWLVVSWALVAGIGLFDIWFDFRRLTAENGSTGPDGGRIHFEVDGFRKHCLLNGLDDIGLTEQKSAEIGIYEAKARLARPWQFGMIRPGA
jgi:hypothetical protein